MPTIVGILTFMSRNNNIIGLSESEKKLIFFIFLYKWAFEISNVLIGLLRKKQVLKAQ